MHADRLANRARGPVSVGWGFRGMCVGRVDEADRPDSREEVEGRLVWSQRRAVLLSA
jgi:hypothetical protein